jgi:hypothetical protein
MDDLTPEDLEQLDPMTRWVAFLVLAFVVFPFAGLAVALGLAFAGGDIGAVLALVVVPALATMLTAIRMDRPNWAVAVSPLISGVIGLAAGIVLAVLFTAQPFD